MLYYLDNLVTFLYFSIDFSFYNDYFNFHFKILEIFYNPKKKNQA